MLKPATKTTKKQGNYTWEKKEYSWKKNVKNRGTNHRWGWVEQKIKINNMPVTRVFLSVNYASTLSKNEFYMLHGMCWCTQSLIWRPLQSTVETSCGYLESKITLAILQIQKNEIKFDMWKAHKFWEDFDHASA